MRDAVIVEAVRTPTGKRNGGLSGIHSADLSAHVLRAIAERTGIDPAVVDDVIWGCVMQIGEQTFDIARTAVLSAGWPESVPGTTVDRQCGSSQQAVHFAAAGVISGQYDVAVAGGVEVMSRTPMGSSFTASPLGADYIARYGSDFPNQGVGAEDIADQWGFSREQLDEYSLRSHERAHTASEGGAFDAQIAPVTNPDGVVVSKDEGIRPGGTMEKLGSLKPAFKEDGKITAGNSSQISDGSAALLIMTSEKAAALGLTPIARIHTAVLAGVSPMPMLHAPMPATLKAFEKSGLKASDIGAYEVNEAFASVPLAWLKDIGADDKTVNPNGGAIALGHPLGMSGARLLLTATEELQRTGGRYALCTMCIGVAQGIAMAIERV